MNTVIKTQLREEARYRKTRCTCEGGMLCYNCNEAELMERALIVIERLEIQIDTLKGDRLAERCSECVHYRLAQSL